MFCIESLFLCKHLLYFSYLPLQRDLVIQQCVNYRSARCGGFTGNRTKMCLEPLFWSYTASFCYLKTIPNQGTIANFITNLKVYFLLQWNLKFFKHWSQQKCIPYIMILECVRNSRNVANHDGRQVNSLTPIHHGSVTHIHKISKVASLSSGSYILNHKTKTIVDAKASFSPFS